MRGATAVNARAGISVWLLSIFAFVRNSICRPLLHGGEENAVVGLPLSPGPTTVEPVPKPGLATGVVKACPSVTKKDIGVTPGRFLPSPRGKPTSAKCDPVQLRKQHSQASA
jgi:hypothetical protein